MLKVKKFVIFLVIAGFVVLMDRSDIYAYGNNLIMPLNLEECSGQSTVSSNVQGTITVKGKWILRNNGTWSYNESFVTHGTSNRYDYSGSVYNRYSDFFVYWVYELPNTDVGQAQIYSIWVYLTCNM